MSVGDCAPQVPVLENTLAHALSGMLGAKLIARAKPRRDTRRGRQGPGLARLTRVAARDQSSSSPSGALFPVLRPPGPFLRLALVMSSRVKTYLRGMLSTKADP